ncbi:hypothetical protein MKX03_001175 [Papaver bracteatum]|nr:hypothetical protein MKX03_001175 [Papaver bracteatum]
MDSVESMFSLLKLHAESTCTIVVAYLGRLGVVLATDVHTAGDGVSPIAAGTTKLADPCPLPSAAKMKGLSENAGYMQVHTAGDGVSPIAAGITKLADPCPLPSAAQVKGLSENAGYMQVELARKQQTYRQRRAMVFPKGGPRTIRRLHKVYKVHTTGDGVFPIAAGITKLADPCPLPSASKMKGLSENAGYTQVELARTQQTYRQRRAMVFPKWRPRTIRQLHKVCKVKNYKHDPCPEIVKYGTTIFTINCGIEGGIYIVVDGLGHTPRRHDGEEELEVHVEEAHEMDGDDSKDGDDADDICGWKEQKAYYLGNNYMVSAVAGSNTWFEPIIQNQTRRMRGNKKLNPEQCAKFTYNYLNNKKNKPNLHKYSMTLEQLREANQMKCEIIYGAYIHHKGELVPSVFVGNETEVLEVVHHQRTGRTRWKPSFFAGGSGGKFAEQVLRYYADQIASDSLTSEEIRMICFEAMEQAYLQDPGTGGMFTVYHIQYDTISEFCVDCTRVRAVIENFNKKKHQQKRRKVKQVEKRQAWQQARARRFRKKRKN